MSADDREPRVLLVSPLPPRTGGMGVQSALWLDRMRADGWPVRALRCNTGDGLTSTWPQWIRRPVRIVLHVIYLLRLLLAVPRAEVIVLVTSSWMTFHLKARPVFRMAAKRGQPILLVYRGGDAENFFAAEGDEVLPVIRRAAHVVVPSQFLVDLFARHGIEATPLPNLINEQRFIYRERPVEPLRGLVTRSLESIYNNACAVRAWAILRQKYPDAELWLAGEGPERAALEKLVDELCPGGVRFLGQVQHEAMGGIYDECTVLVNPTNIDNMPGSVLEGQTAGLPVVSTNVGGVPLVVDHDCTGLLVPPDDPEAMAAAVERLIVEPELATRLVRAAREAVRPFQWSDVGPEWQRIVGEVFAKSR